MKRDREQARKKLERLERMDTNETGSDNLKETILDFDDGDYRPLEIPTNFDPDFGRSVIDVRLRDQMKAAKKASTASPASSSLTSSSSSSPPEGRHISSPSTSALTNRLASASLNSPKDNPDELLLHPDHEDIEREVENGSLGDTDESYDLDEWAEEHKPLYTVSVPNIFLTIDNNGDRDPSTSFIVDRLHSKKE